MELLFSFLLAAGLCGVAEPPLLSASAYASLQRDSTKPEGRSRSASLAGAFGGGGPAADVEGAFLVGPPASDVLGSEDIWGNPTFVGGVANGDSTSHGVW